MGNFVRIGNLLRESRELHQGERRFLTAAENLNAPILFPDVIQDDSYYVHRQPTVELELPEITDAKLTLGEYEAKLITKILDPGEDSVLCIEGDIGSGKTTTINYIVNLLKGRICQSCPFHKENSSCRKLIAHIDFRISNPETSEDVEKSDTSIERMVRIICNELRARVSNFVTVRDEYETFWHELIHEFDNGRDHYVSHVVRDLISLAPDEIRHSKMNLSGRRELVEELRSKDAGWHLRYLILLWRFVQNTKFDGRPGCVLIVFDNVDTLSPSHQRSLVDIMLQSASKRGPAIIILLRPETRKRQGLADTLVEVIKHDGPTPYDVIINRLSRFCTNPEEYFKRNKGLDKEQEKLVINFLKYTLNQLLSDPDNSFVRFINDAAGNSIRLGLLLSQGMLAVRMADMKSPGSLHFLVRACITLGHQQYQEVPKHPIQNLFKVTGYEESNYLVKPRIIRYISERNNSYGLSPLRSVFVAFGYNEDVIKRAIHQLMRNESKLISSDGFDYMRANWGDEQETLYLTAIGKGYTTRLIYDADFLQEIMLDAYVNSSNWPTSYDYEFLTQKLYVFYLFLRELSRTDRDEVLSYIDQHGLTQYQRHFGNILLTTELIQRIYPAIGRILWSTSTKYPAHREIYYEVSQEFLSLLRFAENENKDVLGIDVKPVDEVIMS